MLGMHGTGYFQLQPFTAEPITENLSISGCLVRRSGVVEIEYKVEGALDCIVRPENASAEGRCHELWRHTCFELFFAVRGDSTYWEVNLSPNNCWNIYRFIDYRTGMREEGAIHQPHCQVVEIGDLFSLSCTIDINCLINDSADLEVGINSVIQAVDGSISYWAINHHGSEPDFHNRANFSMVLPRV